MKFKKRVLTFVINRFFNNINYREEIIKAIKESNSNEEIIKSFFTNDKGWIYLRDLDFTGNNVCINSLKAKLILNMYQEAEGIFNNSQKAKNISNGHQESKEISNAFQQANFISNEQQEANNIDNDYQEALIIRNDNQKLKQ